MEQEDNKPTGIELTDVQARALDILEDNETTSFIYGGGAGGGKSYLGCYWILKMCMMYPGTRWLIGRKERKNLYDTTLNSFWAVCTLMGVKREEHFQFKEQDGRIIFENGSEILLKDLQHKPADPNYDTLGGLELTGAFIDECVQITEKAWNIVQLRIRYKLAENNITGKILGTCNPSKNWVYSQYYKPSLDGELPTDKKFMQALITDNPKIEPGYYERIMNAPKAEKERYLGKWEVDDDSALIYFDKINDIFTNEQARDEQAAYFLTCDVARMGSDKAVIALWRGLEVVEMFSYAKSRINELQGVIMTLKTMYKIPNSNVIIDEDGVGGGLVDAIKGCKGFVNNSSALKGENFQNLKTQCYHKLAEYINQGRIFLSADISDKDRECIIEELEQVRSKASDSKLRIISKDEVKSNIGRSPDFSDALMMRMLTEFEAKKIPGSLKFR